MNWGVATALSRRFAAAAVVVAAFGIWSAGAASAASSQRPVVSSLAASPSLVSSHGGVVVVRVQVKHAVTCAFRGQHIAFGSIALRRTLDCRSGRASLRLPVAPNRYRHAVTLHFSVTAGGAHAATDRASINVIQAGRPAPAPKPVPLAIDTKAVPNAAVELLYSTTLRASGGAGGDAWTIASGALPPGLALSGAGVLAGTPTAPGQFTFALRLSDAARHTATVALSLSVAPSAVAPTSDAPTWKSENWSGYGLSGGPFTAVGGTFNVPAPVPGAADSSVAEWVGVDGFGPNSNSIIQAGVAEAYFASAGAVRITPWFELYPAPPFTLPLAVAAGDQVTVSIYQASASGTWDVLVKDDTTGQSANNEFSYGGPASTAEWIVEAPFSTITQSVIPLLPFSPVTFTQLAASPAGAPAKFVMFQNDQQVSTPSPITANGFTVGYGSGEPAAP